MRAISICAATFLLTAVNSLAQEQKGCGLQSKLRELYTAYPGLEADQQELLERSKHYVKSGDRDAVLVIPIVFHVLHENGTENISDAQIYDQVDILNADFRKLNADTTEIVAPFNAIATDTEIEFRLANKDHYGNCTNGIEHIYSHETNIGDDYSKLHQWPRSRYLNVWIVGSMAAGVAGYAYYPSSVATGMYYADGVIILNDFIGSIGTSSPFTSRALTHEIGHWLGLPHVWGSTNNPEVACGDDGIGDTPATAGHLSCVLTGTDDCNAGIEENVQNYMEYSYCSRMYTVDQSAVMNTSLGNVIASRNNLITDENHDFTAIDDGVLCAPLPDFYSDVQLICAGDDVRYFASVSRAIVDSYSWSFPGGVPATSTAVNPVVNYPNPGTYSATLTVTNAAGTESKNRTAHLYVTPDYWAFNGPFIEDFENSSDFYNDGWWVINPEDNESKWEPNVNAGYSGENSIAVMHYKAAPDPALEPHYYQRLGGTQDILISPAYNFSQTSDAQLNFRYAHATINSGPYTEEFLKLRVYYQKSCQTNWTLIASITGLDVLSAGYCGGAFYPNVASDWNEHSVDLPTAAYETNVRFKFEFTAEDYSNNFFLDDINVTGTVNLSDNQAGIRGVTVYPNPVEGDEIRISFNSESGGETNVQITDAVGKLVSKSRLLCNSGENVIAVDLSENMPGGGVYFVTLQNSNGSVSKRFVRK